MGLVILLVVFAIAGVPAYVIGQRSGIGNAWIGFIPLVGPPLILLWSIRQSGWLALLALFPIANLLFFIGLVYALPRAHNRRGLWTLGLLVPIVGIYAYAFTLTPRQYALPHSATARNWSGP